MKHETGVTSHLDRMNLTVRLCELLDVLLEAHGIDFQEYGQNVILRGNGSLSARWKKLDVKKSNVVLMTKFSPDYLLHHKDSGTLFLLDAKASITPMFFGAAIQNIRNVSGVPDLDRHRIGEIEREAWDNYRDRFPPRKVAICFATPYNPNLVVAEWASELQSLYRFVADSNEAAAGSKTPHVNVDLNDMRPLDQFLTDELGVEIDQEMYSDLLDEVKSWGLNKPNRINWAQFNNVVAVLRGKCPWVRGRVPKKNDDYHERIRIKLRRLGIPFEEF